MIKIVIIDPYTILRDAVQEMLSKHEDFSVVCSSSRGDEILTYLNNNDADIILAEWSLEDMTFIQFMNAMSNSRCQGKVIIFSMIDTGKVVHDGISSGASGYLSKKCNSKELENIIRSVNGGLVAFDNRIFQDYEQYAKRNQYTLPVLNKSFGDSEISLTEKELEITQLITHEKTTQEIADILNLSKRTVEAHRNNIMQKFGVRNVVGVVLMAIKLGLVGYTSLDENNE